MKNYFISLLSISLFSCLGQDESKIVILAQHLTKAGDSIRLEIRTDGYLGATTPNVTWIIKSSKNGDKQYIGKIRRWLNKGELIFSPVDDSLLNVQYIDSTWHDTTVYIINLLQIIHLNDNSDYIQASPKIHP